MKYRQCTKCKRELPENKFEKVYKKSGYGTLRNVCRLCKNKSDIKIKQRKDTMNKYYQKNSQMIKERIRKERSSGKNKIKNAAQRMVGCAVEIGLLIKPIVCQWCGEIKKSRNMIAHHKSYLSPLDVIWLCPTCHMSTHRMIKESRQLRIANEVEHI